MRTTPKGQIIVPTGGGKTLCMIKDTIEEFNGNSDPKTIVVVAPRILLAEQLSEEFIQHIDGCLLYTSPSPRDATLSRMPSSG